MSAAAIFSCLGPNLGVDEAAFFRDSNPWGFILFRRNVENAEQVRALTDELRGCVGWAAPVFMDQEGGTVQRLHPPLARNWPDAKTHRGGARAAYVRHRLMAAELRAVGVDGNCAPVIDVASAQTHPFLQRRIWSDDPAEVATLARAAAEGLLAGGVLPVIKHLPGHGAANADSHHGLARCSDPLATLTSRDFVPVKALADLPLGMTGHMIFDALDPEHPTSHSPVVLDYLRTTLGFDGLLMTDDLGMNALGGTMGGRATKAMSAGCDVALHCSGDMVEMQAVANAVGTLTEHAKRRADRALSYRQTPDEIDIAALSAEFDGLGNAEV